MGNKLKCNGGLGLIAICRIVKGSLENFTVYITPCYCITVFGTNKICYRQTRICNVRIYLQNYVQ